MATDNSIQKELKGECKAFSQAGIK